MASESSEKLAESVALGVLDLAAEVRGRHLVSLVAHHQVPVGAAEFGLDIFIPAQLVEAADGQWSLCEPVARAGGLEFVVRENVEGELEALIELVLPLFRQVAWADDEAAMQVAADQQFLDQQPGHDGFSGTGVVGQEEPKRLPRQHLAVDSRYLVRQRVDDRGVNRQQRIKEVGQIDSVRFRHQPEELAVAVEAPRTAGFDYFQGGFAIAIEQLYVGLAGRILIGKLNRCGPIPPDVDYSDQAVGQYALDGGAPLEILQFRHSRLTLIAATRNRFKPNDTRKAEVRTSASAQAARSAGRWPARARPPRSWPSPASCSARRTTACSAC